MNIHSDRLFNLRFNWQSFISQYPKIYSAWNGLRSPTKTLGLSKQATDLVLEGYPRSGNSFAWYAFMLTQTCPFNVIHHTHKSARVIEAVKNEIPTLVLIRNPQDSIISYCIYEPRLSLEMATIHWIRFYQSLTPYMNGFVLASFDQVIKDFGLVIANVNNQFNTPFEEFNHSDDNVNLVFEKMEFRTRLISQRVKHRFPIDERIGKPTDRRNGYVKEHQERIKIDKKLAQLVGEARSIYDSFISVIP